MIDSVVPLCGKALRLAGHPAKINDSVPCYAMLRSDPADVMSCCGHQGGSDDLADGLFKEVTGACLISRSPRKSALTSMSVPPRQSLR